MTAVSREHILSLAFDRSTDGLLLLEDDLFIDCNPAALRLLGYTHQSEIIGRHPADFSPQYQPDGKRSDLLADHHIALALRQGSHCFEWSHQKRDGTLLPVDVLLTVMKYEGRRILHSNWRDITRRRDAEQALAYRRELETLITRTSGYFINLPTEDIDAGIHQALGDMGRFVEADRSYVFAYENELMTNQYEWCADGIEPQIHRMKDVPIHNMHWSNQQIMSGKILNTFSVDDLPPEAHMEKAEFVVQEVKSLLVVPMERRGEVVGFIGFDSVRQPRHWPEAIVDLLQMAAGIIANVLDRRDAELKLKEINATLEQRVKERTLELEERRKVAEGLRETLSIVNSNLSIVDTLTHIVQQARTLTGASACVLYSIDFATQTGQVEVGSGLLEEEKDHLQFDLDTRPGQELLQIVSRNEPIGINYDIRSGGTANLEDGIDMVLSKKRAGFGQVFRASISMPLFVKETPYGALLLYYAEQQAFTDRQYKIAMILAEQASLAIDNARLHESEQERRNEAEQRHYIAEGLREGLAVLNSNRPLCDILDFIVCQAVQLLDTGGGALYLLDAKQEMLSVGASFGLDDSYTQLKIPVGGAITGRAVALREPVSVPDMQKASRLLNEYLSAPNMSTDWIDALGQLTARYNAVLSVPVLTHHHTYGALTLYYPTHQQFTDEVIQLAVAFAGQAALVIENARLRELVRKTAILEERNRLARDLHDAVTQTLFSASTIADTLPELWDIDQADARQQLKLIGQLSRGALAEMRTLLIELRPARLINVDIKTLLKQLIDAAQGRSKVDITLNIHGTCHLPTDVKIAFYRITQEALNNIIKHANASHSFISLRYQNEQVVLQILDDGCGFTPDTIEAGHFGIQIMQERAKSVGAIYTLDSSPGEGTEIRVIWRKP